MACEFVEEKFSLNPIIKGWTAFAEKENACIRDTGIYLPPNHAFDNDVVNVVLWFHGFYVSDAKDLIHPSDSAKDMKLRESVLTTRKDVILVAPWLGLTHKMDLGSLNQGDGCQTYLELVLGALARFRKTLSSQASSSLDIGKLVLAGHSAGGAMMRAASKHLGRFKSNLKECWGFDCFYDDLYPGWSRENPKVDKVFYIGNGSGGGGLHAFKMMKEVYGTPQNPIRGNKGLPNTWLAPAVDRAFTADDYVAFQSIEDILDWGPSGPNKYNDVRRATDPFLGDKTQTKYWNTLLPNLTDHFQVVRNLFAPRIKQSRWL